MSDHVHESPAYVKGPPRYTAICQFTTAGTGAITGFAGQGVVSVTRTGVGVFEALLAEGWIALQPRAPAISGAAAAQLGRPVITSITRSTRKVVITVVDFQATPAAVETTAVTIYCEFALQRTQ